jgi:uncharacterized glyoxalase superfamily protein PhnB
MDATVAFDRGLGLDIPAPFADAESGRHGEVKFANGFSLEFDDVQSARLYNASWRTDGTEPTRVLITFRMPTRESVDSLYADITGAGDAGVQIPYDTFWGARYAIVADPDGNHVGLMSPSDDARRVWPPSPSPSE